MAGFSSDTHQLHQLADQLRAAGVELADLEPANAEAGRIVLADVRPPRLSGYLGDHLVAGPAANGVTFASTARYWTFVHWGAPRRHIRARPFFTEALDHDQDKVLAVYADHAQHALEEIK